MDHTSFTPPQSVFTIKSLHLILFLGFWGWIGPINAQMGYKSLGLLSNQSGAQIELKVKMSKNPCAQVGSDNQFVLKMSNVENAYPSGYFLKWQMRIIQCNGDILVKSFTINLDNYHLEGNNESQDWNFPGERIEVPFAKVRIEQNDYNDKDVLIQNIKSKPPSSIQGNLLLMTGESTTLSVSPDGQLGTNSNWYWYKDNCGGNSIGQGTSIKVTPSANTTYFVRAISKDDTSSCVSALVEVDDNSKVASKIIGPNKRCLGDPQQVKLEVFGGKLGYNANWAWYEDACGSIKLGVGKVLTVIPKKTTTYFVRAEGQTNTTACVSLTVNVEEESIEPVSIAGNLVVCYGETTQLTVEGGRLAMGAAWTWYTGSINQMNKIGVGSIIQVKPLKETAYYVRGEGFCNTTKSVLATVAVNKISSLPNYITAKQIKNRRYQLTALGGTLGDNANWVWYKDKCKSSSIGEGQTIEYRASKQNSVFVGARGGCGDPAGCTPYQFAYKKSTNSKDRFTGFMNFGLLSIDGKVSLDNLVITLGSRRVYLRGKFGITQNEDGSAISPSYACNDLAVLDFNTNTINYYQFNGKVYNRRRSVTAGFMMGGNVRLYLGAGYGAFDPIWGIDIKAYQGNTLIRTDWALNTTHAIKGLEGEGGLFINFGKVNIMGGANIIYSTETKRQHIDATIGMGLTF